MEDTATLRIGNENYNLPMFKGTEGEVAIDTRKLRADTGCVAFDEGYGNTGSCNSNITFINGEKGILRHRGYSIESLAENSNFLETAYLVIYGELPSESQLEEFNKSILGNVAVHEGMKKFYEGFPVNSHPMAILSSLMQALGCYYPEMTTNDRDKDLATFDSAAAVLIAKVISIAATTYRIREGLPVLYPKRGEGYCDNFLHMLYSEPNAFAEIPTEISKALNLILLLHTDHEQNCSTSTVRMVASGGANLFASVSAGVSALWGPSHGGANMAVIKMLNEIHASGDDGSQFLEDAKNGKARLMGFGHRVYKNYDPRAKILKASCEKVLDILNVQTPILEIAKKLESVALEDDYFVKRKLYPNVDFYSGIILQSIGIPLDMFTVIFAIGRMPGWIAHWKELAEGQGRIHRPRQIYTGEILREYSKIATR